MHSASTGGSLARAAGMALQARVGGHCRAKGHTAQEAAAPDRAALQASQGCPQLRVGQSEHALRRTAPRCGQGQRLGAPAVHQKGQFGVVRGLSLPRQLIGGGGLTSVRRGTARTACLTLPMGCAIRPANGTGACGERGRRASNPAQHPRERLGGQRAVGRCAVLCAMLRGCALGRIAA